MSQELPKKMSPTEQAAEADRANQAKTNLLAMVSHDMRSPLTAIIGYADLLAMGVPEPLTDGNREHVTRIRVSAEHLLCLLDQLLVPDCDTPTPEPSA
jgi:signal transduction histidine kinase